MFTGIIEEIGTIEKLELKGKSGTIKIAASKILEGTKIGDSICVNGICITVTSILQNAFLGDVMAETVRRSNLQSAKVKDKVNLERAMSANDRFGGHIVSGHIDGIGIITRTENEENATWLYVSTQDEILNLIVQKGSIALDGVSLTVAKVNQNEFAVSIIPHTKQSTTLLLKKAGDKVNLENDIIGKYVKRFMETQNSQLEKDEKFKSWLLA